MSEPSADRYRIRSEDKVAVRHYDFDRVGHGLPVRLEELRRTPGRPGEWYVHDWATTRWEKRQGVWLPVEIATQVGPDSGSFTRYELTLAWEKVNEPLDETLFQARGMGLPAETVIADQKTSDSGMHLGKVGDVQPHPRLVELERYEPRSRWWWFWVAGGVVGLAVIGLVVCWWFRRRG